MTADGRDILGLTMGTGTEGDVGFHGVACLLAQTAQPGDSSRRRAERDLVAQ